MKASPNDRIRVNSMLFLALGGLSTVADADCPLTRELTFDHAEIGTVQVFRDPTSRAIAFASQMQVNTDGTPDSYHPDDIGITHLCNGINVAASCTWKAHCLPEFRQAKAEGFRGPTKICFFAMATDARGVPIIQCSNDPFIDRFGKRRAYKGIGGRDVVYLLFPGSARPGERLDAASIEQAAKPLLERFGGTDRFRDCH